MREKPALPQGLITSCLRDHYGIDAVSARFLPIGYDLKAFVFECLTSTGDSYFVKVREGVVDPAGLLVPRVLTDHGVPNILAPLKTGSQTLSCTLDSYSVVVYPFVRGENAMIAGLDDDQWREFGATLRVVHDGGFPKMLKGVVPTESFSLPSADAVRCLTSTVYNSRFDSPSATQWKSAWAEHRGVIEHIQARAEELAGQLQRVQFDCVLCHADIHAANIMVERNGGIVLVDWDGPLIAPRERDLLFIIGSRISRRVEPREEALFFEGYGKVEVNPDALTYFRYERILEDIEATGRAVFHDGALSEQAKCEEARLFAGLFQSGDIVEAIITGDRHWTGPPTRYEDR